MSSPDQDQPETSALEEQIAQTLKDARRIRKSIQTLEKKIGAEPKAIETFLRHGPVDAARMEQAQARLLDIDHRIGRSLSDSSPLSTPGRKSTLKSSGQRRERRRSRV